MAGKKQYAVFDAKRAIPIRQYSHLYKENQIQMSYITQDFTCHTLRIQQIVYPEPWHNLFNGHVICDLFMT